MNTDFNWKKFQFIIEVQTALINNAINLSLEDDAKKRRHIFSATGTLIHMDDAFYAAERIPESLTAHEAAHQFVYFICENLREDSIKNQVGKCWWFMRE
jgi:hypothetical protein